MAILESFPEKKGLNADDINDIASGSISNGFVQSQFNYSTEEQIIGKWVDGKPLYQKTLKINTTLDVGDHKFDHGVANLDTVYSITGIIISRGTNHDEYSTGIVEAQATTQLVNTYWQRSLNKIHIYNNMNYGATTAYITIQYTKTTDT